MKKLISSNTLTSFAVLAKNQFYYASVTLSQNFVLIPCFNKFDAFRHVVLHTGKSHLKAEISEL